MSFYHCIKCYEIPLISIDNDKITVICEKDGHYEIPIDKYYNECIEKCANGDDNYPNYLFKNEFYCLNCMKKSGIKNYESYNYLTKFFSCKNHRNQYYNSYCVECKENKCQKCKKDDQNHYYIPNQSFNDKNEILRTFITTTENKIKKIENLLHQMTIILEIYKSLLFDKSYIVNKKIISNFQNLNIIKNIDYFKDEENKFFEKLNLIVKELDNIKYLEFLNNKKKVNNNFVPNNIKENNNNAKRNYNVKLIMIESNNNGMIDNNFKMKNGDINDKNEFNNEKVPKIYIHKAKNDKNKTVIQINRNNDNQNKYNNKQMGNNCFLKNRGKKEEEFRNSKKNVKEIEVNNTVKLNACFQMPKDKLYQKYAIKLEDIENHSRYIIDKIIKMSQNIEDEIDDDMRNSFLFSVGNIARVANNYSYELAKILIDKFHVENKEFSSIIYERAKTELSSWVNQSLTIDESNKDIKNLRYFYSYYSDKEKSRIDNYILSDKTTDSILKQNNFNFYYLFRDLSQLYTEALLYSDKDIILNYVENCDFDHEKMIDVAELNSRGFVKFTILPGLLVGKYSISHGKILVFCEKKSENNFSNPFSNSIPNNKVLSLDKTIRSEEIRNKLSCKIEYSKIGNDFEIKIVTVPKIPRNDYPKYSIKTFDTRNNPKEIMNSDDSVFYIEIKDYAYKKIFGNVKINGENIDTNVIQLQKYKK